MKGASLAARAAVPVALLVAWQAAVGAGLLSKDWFSSPAGVVQAFRELNDQGILWGSVAVSLGRAFLGLFLGGLAGLATGIAVGLLRGAETALDATIQMVRTLPHLALVPLFLIWFGIGEESKVALVALGSFFPLYLNTFKAIRGIDPKLIELAKVQKLSRFQLIREIILPGAMPGILVGLRYSLGTAWLSLIVAEQLNAQSGIGFLTMQARMFAQTSVIMACLCLYALVGILADVLVRSLEKSALKWHPSART
ncbi:ABC transporter permease subunit [Aquabacter sp. CN5-332]|uniref:ABC transporter permease subunit n=1 Tax=Aquabacter sp. CN5-332 TaxID=3156608 RepID=UPI0032B4BD97